MSALAAFLLAFPALFSIVNPPGVAFIFHEITAGLPHEAKARLAGRVGLYSLLVMVTALWGGAYVLNFFGISLGALRIAGGAVVALRAWDLLMSPEQQEQRKTAQAGAALDEAEGIAFFPLTMPFTTGPGTISVAIALGAERPASGQGLLAFFLGVTAAALAVALLVWLSYRSADRLVSWLGAPARRIISRMSAFLLLCIGVQVMLNGVEDEIHRIAGLLG
jgi:multiple antibiotic resistance protein